MSDPKADMVPAKRKFFEIGIAKALPATREFMLDFMARYAAEMSKTFFQSLKSPTAITHDWSALFVFFSVWQSLGNLEVIGNTGNMSSEKAALSQPSQAH
jgi:hypothetical protein